LCVLEYARIGSNKTVQREFVREFHKKLVQHRVRKKKFEE